MSNSEPKKRKRPRQQITVTYTEEFVEDQKSFDEGFRLFTQYMVTSLSVYARSVNLKVMTSKTSSNAGS